MLSGLQQRRHRSQTNFRDRRSGLVPFGPGELRFRAFDMDGHEAVDVVFADEGIRLAGLPPDRKASQFFEAKLSSFGVDVDDGIDAGLILRAL